jgi:CheY-like chemotaxis protein
LSQRILIIDDETSIRAMMKLSLEHVGYLVETASDGQEGLAKYGDGALWDLVLVDQRMPGLSGIEVQREIHGRNPEAKLILITAHGTIDLALEAIQAGASDFLRKPFTAETLRSAVKSALERPVVRHHAVPVGVVCREFTRSTINGFSFELDHQTEADDSHDIECVFNVSRASDAAAPVRVILPNYVQELAKAHADTESLPGGERFWSAMAEEALANYLWHHAARPEGGVLRVEDLSSGLARWLDSVMTVSLAEG